MFRRELLVWLVLATIMSFGVSTVWAATIFEEFFTGLTPGANITTGNTAFDYVRIGTGGGTITSERTASGEDYMRLGGTSSTSLNGVGVQSSLGDLDIVTMNFRMRLESTTGTIFFGMGSGNMFTGNGGFNTAQLMWGLQVNNGTLQFRTEAPGTWNNFDPSITLIAGQNYEFHIIANRSGVDITYQEGTETINDGQMHAYLNGTLIGDVPITNNQNATGFRIYQINNGLYAGFDSITIHDEVVDPFTPTAVTLHSLTATAATPLWAILLFTFTMLIAAVTLIRRHRLA